MALMMKNLNNDTDVFVAQTSSIGTDGVLAIELLGDLTETDDDDKVCGCGGGYVYGVPVVCWLSNFSVSFTLPHTTHHTHRTHAHMHIRTQLFPLGGPRRTRSSFRFNFKFNRSVSSDACIRLPAVRQRDHSGRSWLCPCDRPADRLHAAFTSGKSAWQ